MSLNNNNTGTVGMDSVLTRRGKLLQTGESLRMTLVKGPSVQQQLDPSHVKFSKPQPHLMEDFPQVLKFSESVVRPDFSLQEWKTARLHQLDVPKASDDSEDDEQAPEKKKRRRRYNQNDVPKRQWILQQEEDYLQSMICKRQGKPPWDTSVESTRYEGSTESNPSHYVVLSCNGNDGENQIRVLTLAQNAVQSMSQPNKLATMSMTEAEQAIQDQRGKMTRYMMHKNNSTQSKVSSKQRLMGKLSQKQVDEDGDDVMGDVAFRSRKGSNNTARRELLSSLAEEGMTVDEEGVLGGANDAEFGGKRHFGKFQHNKQQQQQGVKKSQEKKAASGNDGLAMADNFYQRDVQAEYEELDYDANELFDDDDVDLGEAEVMVDAGGFAAEDEDDDDDEEDNDNDNVVRGGAEGLATVAGFRAMLAKARGESSPTTSDDEGTATNKEEEKNRPTSPSGKTAATPAAATTSATTTTTKPAPATTAPASMSKTDSALAQVQAAAAAAAEKASQKKEKTVPSPATVSTTTNATNIGKKEAIVEVDENGMRLISLEAMRREIWLQNGHIPLKRLMKLFDMKKATVARRKRFMDLVKELCTMTKDPLGERVVVLKQHYANMG